MLIAYQHGRPCWLCGTRLQRALPTKHYPLLPLAGKASKASSDATPPWGLGGRSVNSLRSVR